MGAAFGVESSIPQPQLGLGASCISADVGAILILPQKLQQRRPHPPPPSARKPWSRVFPRQPTPPAFRILPKGKHPRATRQHHVPAEQRCCCDTSVPAALRLAPQTPRPQTPASTGPWLCGAKMMGRAGGRGAVPSGRAQPASLPSCSHRCCRGRCVAVPDPGLLFFRGKMCPLPASSAEPLRDHEAIPPPCLSFPSGHGPRGPGPAVTRLAKPKIAFLATFHCCLAIATAGTMQGPGARRALPAPGVLGSEGTGMDAGSPGLCRVGTGPRRGVWWQRGPPRGWWWWWWWQRRSSLVPGSAAPAICSGLTPAPTALGTARAPRSGTPRAGSAAKRGQELRQQERWAWAPWGWGGPEV